MRLKQAITSEKLSSVAKSVGMRTSKLPWISFSAAAAMRRAGRSTDHLCHRESMIVQISDSRSTLPKVTPAAIFRFASVSVSSSERASMFRNSVMQQVVTKAIREKRVMNCRNTKRLRFISAPPCSPARRP